MKAKADAFAKANGFTLQLLPERRIRVVHVTSGAHFEVTRYEHTLNTMREWKQSFELTAAIRRALFPQEQS